MPDAVSYVDIALMAFFALTMLWVAVPLGFGLGVPPLAVALIVIPCSIFGATLVIWIVAPLRGIVRRRYSERNRRGEIRYIFRIWRKCGLPGVGILGPLLVGPPPTMAIGLLLGSNPRRLLAWTSLGIVLWTGFMELVWWLGRDMFHTLFG
jgi:hypothetical protein